MSLDASEIAVGAIAYFNLAILNMDPLAMRTGDPATSSVGGNQFVCYKIEGSESYWTRMTGIARAERLRLKSTWIENGYGALASGMIYLQDGKNSYRGPSTSFISAAKDEELFIKGRPVISAMGVEAIIAAVKARGGAC